MKHIVLTLALAGLPFAAQAQGFDALTRPGVVGLMRHALAPGTGDPASFDLTDCSTQRQLSDRGREQARRTGAALRDAGVVFDAVWTSQWCRAHETATLLDVGTVTEVPALNSHFAGQGDRDAQTAEIQAKLAALPEGTRVLLVSHQVNISALTGSPTSSGEFIAAMRDANGKLTPLQSYLIAP